MAKPDMSRNKDLAGKIKDFFDKESKQLNAVEA